MGSIQYYPILHTTLYYTMLHLTILDTWGLGTDQETLYLGLLLRASGCCYYDMSEAGSPKNPGNDPPLVP